MGVVLIASLISGAVVYGPFMRKLPFGTVRKYESSRTQWLDLHNVLGIATRPAQVEEPSGAPSVIPHEGQAYTFRKTNSGKLILTK